MLAFRRALAAAALPCALAAALLAAPRPAAAQTRLRPDSQPATAPAAPAAAPDTAAPASASAAAPLPIVFSGELRTRSERDHPTGAPADAFTYLRARFGVRVDPAPGARLVLQVQDSRVLGAEGNAAAAVAEQLDLHQGYVELSAPWRGIRAAARVGRQEIALGNERLVGAVGWSNVGRSFDGVRVLLAPDGAAPGAERWTATAFAATVEERGPRFGPSGAGARAADHAVVGAFATRALAAAGAAEVTALYDAGARYRGYNSANRATLDVRLRAPRVLGLSAELEGALQAGRQRDAADSASVRAQDVRAWLVGARVGTATAPARRAAAAVGVDVLSGDATPHDGRYTAFATAYATNHPFYGVMDLIGDPAATTRERGLVDALATGSAKLTGALALRGELHHFTLATGAGRDLGWEADVTLPLSVAPAAGVELGYSAFRAGRDAASVGFGAAGSYRDWGYVQLRVAF